MAKIQVTERLEDENGVLLAEVGTWVDSNTLLDRQRLESSKQFSSRAQLQKYQSLPQAIQKYSAELFESKDCPSEENFNAALKACDESLDLRILGPEQFVKLFSEMRKNKEKNLYWQGLGKAMFTAHLMSTYGKDQGARGFLTKCNDSYSKKESFNKIVLGSSVADYAIKKEGNSQEASKLFDKVLDEKGHEIRRSEPIIKTLIHYDSETPFIRLTPGTQVFIKGSKFYDNYDFSTGLNGTRLIWVQNKDFSTSKINYSTSMEEINKIFS